MAVEDALAQPPHAPATPAGTVTFLFTDVEGSTQRWERDRLDMERRMASHDDLLRRAVEAHGGYVFKMMGDGCCAAFWRAGNAVAAAVAAQEALGVAGWNGNDPIRVRMALHTGSAQERDGDYFGPPVNRVARLLSTGYGGQVLVSLATQRLLLDALPTGVTLVDLGEHRLRDLMSAEHIFQLSAAGLDAKFPPLNTLDAIRSNLPIQASSFVGREAEVAQILALLRDEGVRLVTLTGAGGTGKTRLALQVGAEILEEFRDGVFFSDLAPLTEPAQVMTAIRASIGVPEGAGGELETVVRSLGQKRELLIVDNFEHLLDAAPGLSEVLSRCPEVKMLVTSRAPLRLPGEHDHAVPPLMAPGGSGTLSAADAMGHEAVRLFVLRATAARRDFELTDGNAAAVASICAQLDGLPLAIELAAARVRMFRPEQLLERMSQGEGSLAMLTSGVRGAPERQQTLRGAIEWSYRLLGDDAGLLLPRLSVFRGGWTFDAAEAVCGSAGCDVFAGMEALLEGSLIYERAGENGESRYGVLETVRQFAEAQLRAQPEDATRQLHAEYFADLATRLHHHQARDRDGAIARLRMERENFSLAVSTLLSLGGRPAASELAGNARQAWSDRPSEARRVLDAVLPSRGQETAADVDALCAAGNLAVYPGDLEAAESFYSRGESLARREGDGAQTAVALVGLGEVAFLRGDPSRTLELAERAREASHEAEVGHLAGEINNLKGRAYILLGERGRALEVLEAAAQAFRANNDSGGLASALGNVAEMRVQQGDDSAAEELYREAIAVARLNQGYAAVLKGELANLLRARGEFGEAHRLARSALAVVAELGHVESTCYLLTYLAGIGSATGDSRFAARLYAAAEAAMRASGMHIQDSYRPRYEAEVSAARATLGDDDAWNREWTAGGRTSLDEAVEFALTWELPPVRPGAVTPKPI